MNRLSCLLVLAFLVVVAGGSRTATAAGDDQPQWLREAMAASLPKYEKNVPAAVLLNEQRVTVDGDGRVVTVQRYVVRILTREGQSEAHGAVSYMTHTGKVREMRGWLVKASGEVKKYGKDQVVEIAAAPNDVFDEVRIKALHAGSEAEAGAVFAYEAVSEDRSVFTQFDFQFQAHLPSLVSRFALSLPQGWRAESVTFNHARIAPAMSGSAYTWELRDLAPIEDEPASPPVTNLAARLAVSYYPTPGSKLPGRTFEKWSDVSRWLSELADPQAVPNGDITARAATLTTGAKTAIDRIRSIGRFVQSINYVSIQTGVGRGGGYRPRAAAEVFAKSYGDCKDKANLMRVMLKTIGIESYPVVIYSGDPTYVREEWPSPQQFNHCIIGVLVGDDTDAATVVRHPSLGRLLVFDPTDGNTPVGDLPDHEQGSLALVVAGDAGTLLRMPTTKPEANRLERQTEIVLAADGRITARIRERAMGHAAAAARREFRDLPRPEYVKLVEGWITRAATGARVSKVEASDSNADGEFSLEVEFAADRYGQLMQNRLLVFKPAVVSRRESLFLTSSSRKYPVVLDSEAYSETMTATLPPGFVVDELPNAVKLEAPFGKYAAGCEVKEGRLVFTRSLVLQSATVPVEKYAEARSFFDRIRSAEQAPVVLAKK